MKHAQVITHYCEQIRILRDDALYSPEYHKSALKELARVCGLLRDVAHEQVTLLEEQERPKL